METKEKDYAAQLQTTAETIATHVEKKSVTGLTGAVNKWIDVLEAHKDLKPIAANLKKLLTAIEEKDVKHIASLMKTLGEESSKASEKATGSEATKIKALAKALTAGSETIAKFA